MDPNNSVIMRLWCIVYMYVSIFLLQLCPGNTLLFAKHRGMGRGVGLHMFFFWFFVVFFHIVKEKIVQVVSLPSIHSRK